MTSNDSFSDNSFPNVSFPGTIHFNESYLKFQVTFNGFPQILAVVPWIYMIPSFYIILKILNVYLKSNWNIAEAGKNKYIFQVISLSQLTNFAFCLFEYLMVRVPSTGFFTSWCASIQPNHLLKLIFMGNYQFNYSSMLFPFLMPLVRLIIVSLPRKHEEVNKILVRFAIPFIFIYPIFFTFFLIPAVGVCKQLDHPYPFGSVHIYYANPAFGLRSSYFYLYNTVVWLILSTLANIVLFFKLWHTRKNLVSTQRSAISYRAETSISIITVVMILFYVINGCFIFIYLLYYGTPGYNIYFVVLKSFANDLQACVVPWLFYLTHPAFRKKKERPIIVTSSDRFGRMLNGNR